MELTLHAEKRKVKRGIMEEAIELAFVLGSELKGNPDRILLNRKMLWEAVRLNILSKNSALRLEKTVPIVVVSPNKTIVTVFRPNQRINRSKHGFNHYGNRSSDFRTAA